MKKILLNCFILLSLGSYSQITLDFQTRHFWINPVKLTDNETKYLDNPNNGSFYVQIHSKEGKENIIDLYSSTGNLIGTYKSSNEIIQINTLGLPEGLYYLNNRLGNKNSGTRMIIKK